MTEGGGGGGEPLRSGSSSGGGPLRAGDCGFRGTSLERLGESPKTGA